MRVIVGSNTTWIILSERNLAELQRQLEQPGRDSVAIHKITSGSPIVVVVEPDHRHYNDETGTDTERSEGGRVRESS